MYYLQLGSIKEQYELIEELWDSPIMCPRRGQGGIKDAQHLKRILDEVGAVYQHAALVYKEGYKKLQKEIHGLFLYSMRSLIWRKYIEYSTTGV